MILVVKPQTPEDTLHRFIQDIESTGLQTDSTSSLICIISCWLNGIAL